MAQKILVIDDSAVASRLAELENCDILVANRASDGLERFHLAQPDLILLNDSLPDMDGETVCFRLLNDPFMKNVPVVVMSNNGHAKSFLEKYANVVKTVSKPATIESLLPVLNSTLAQVKPQAHPSTTVLFRDAAKMVYSAHSDFFRLRNAIQMACSDKLTGALRVFLNRMPVELYFSRGKFVFASTRDFELYLRESPAILGNTNLGQIVEAQAHQGFTGCPAFLYLAVRGGFPHDDVVQITRDHGKRLFAHLWTAGRVHFEFEEMSEFPEFARNFPPSDEDPENWILSSLRHVKYDALTAAQRPDPAGSPVYTRKGYELVQRLKLNDIEARFASCINGTDTLPQISKKIGVPLNDALLIVFRLQTMEIIDYWLPSALGLPGGDAKSAEPISA
jgi:CheY-like chemotaxis protein